jgi:23S rRNA pseudouridine955/2504/2580 synthase
LIIVAKNAKALREMDRAIAERQVHKIYRCKVISPPPKLEDTVVLYLKKVQNNKVDVSPIPKNGYKESITKYRILSTEQGTGKNNQKNYTELEIELITGRTHQIRAVMGYLGSPLVGDTKYGGGFLNGVNGQELRACRLVFECDGNLSYLNQLIINN